PLVARFGREREAWMPCQIGPPKHLPGWRPRGRLEKMAGHLGRARVDEISQLLEAIPHRAGACTRVRDVARRDPGEAPDRSARLAKVHFPTDHERRPRKPRGLPNRMSAVVDLAAQH